ncbi:hypothetical protein [Mesorhizobium denitrificans]|uniref:hypothetical protein n=1 Tax=Mesorhizobium denitrificans TaxID=2294114 RepID=UPI0011C05CB2|nr:hypothetical protein [Mesorhizobium denitrificans]
MSSTHLTPHNIATINRLVLEVRQFGPTRDVLRERSAAHTAGMRLLKGPLTEGELRAVIYDAVFSHAIDEMKARYSQTAVC